MGSLFCDGACSGNGTARSRGGWAWAWWAGTVVGEPTVARAEPLETPPTATNQRAELTALLEALRWWSAPVGEYGGGGGPVTIHTDSMYALNCASTWGPGWRRRGWKRSSGEPIQNLDLIRPLVDIWRPEWRLVHVRGHQTGSGPTVVGNNWVDRAAVLAAEETPTVIDRRPLTGVTATTSSSTASTFPVARHTTTTTGGGSAAGRSTIATAARHHLTASPYHPTDIRNWFGSGK
jgi:ribonuclease HI